MRAARIHGFGEVPQVDEIDQPASNEGFKVDLAALNPVDIAISEQRVTGSRPSLPYVVGSEAVGRRADGRRVWSRGRGMIAEVAPLSDYTFDVPDGVSDDVALACGIAGLTAWTALSWRAPVQRNDTVLVLGASGIVGSTAVQAARLLGAARVIGAARHVEDIPEAATETVDLAGGQEMLAASLIIDCLWGAPLERALAVADKDVRVVQIGQAAGRTASLQSDWIRGKQAVILGHTLKTVPTAIAQAGYMALCDHTGSGRIVLRTEEHALSNIATAWRRQATSPHAKIVVRPS